MARVGLAAGRWWRMDVEQLLGAPDVTAAVEALLVAVADAYAAAQARSGSPVSPRTPPERASLARLVTAERAVGLLAAEGLVAHESLVAAIADEVEVEHCSLGRPSARSRVLDDARVLAGDEIVAATGLGVHEVRRRSRGVTAPPVVRERLLKRCARGPRRCSARPRWSTRCARAACPREVDALPDAAAARRARLGRA
ncbi:hypothetical protein GGG17_04440 [Arsenicicoccus sp. MKL-02]|uniref:Uncharacterized protein n=1 Tax=Arsenicicoccus cauae TaxID=2663847 RepID=A0A6I3I502_9MICO|nr:hypothetical protein [Arsenicicoccus cauae]MTB71234.1 hypothetical protein [Arsenicicoccus cauae]